MKLFISLPIFILIPLYSLSQDNLTVKIHKTNSIYTKIAHHENQIYAITNSGNVIIWDLNSLDTVSFTHNDTAQYRFLCVTKDKQNQLYFGTDKGHIFQYKPGTGEWVIYKKIKYSVHHVFFNSENNPILIVPYAVYDPIQKRHWTKFENRNEGLIVKKKVLGLFSKRIYSYFNMPDYTFLDSRDRLWMTASFGEFGGSVQIFDTRNYRVTDSKLDSISLELMSPKSVFEGSNNEIFITSGLQHFSNSGTIYQIDSTHSIRQIFNSSGRKRIERKTGKVLDEGGLFIGPGAYNKNDSCIYFATSRGIHKMNIYQDQEPDLVINPDLTWTREPLAIGVAMNIKKMEFLPDGSLMFLTSNDGIGILTGNNLTLLK